MKNLLFVETPMNATTNFHSIHSTKIQRNTGNLVEIHSTKFSKEISLNEKRRKQLSPPHATHARTGQYPRTGFFVEPPKDANRQPPPGSAVISASRRVPQRMPHPLKPISPFQLNHGQPATE
jgi:hypothetical protein